jgi:hypothetical protein
VFAISTGYCACMQTIGDYIFAKHTAIGGRLTQPSARTRNGQHGAFWRPPRYPKPGSF